MFNIVIINDSLSKPHLLKVRVLESDYKETLAQYKKARKTA